MQIAYLKNYKIYNVLKLKKKIGFGDDFKVYFIICGISDFHYFRCKKFLVTLKTACILFGALILLYISYMHLYSKNSVVETYAINLDEQSYPRKLLLTTGPGLLSRTKTTQVHISVTRTALST